MDLQAFAIDPFGIGQMQVCCDGKDRLEEGTEGGLEVGAGELGVGHIQADAHAGFLAELLDEFGVDKQVVIALPAEMPGEGGHGLGNDLHLASGVDLLKAVDQALAQRLQFRALEMVVFGEAADVRHQKNGIGAAEAAAQITGDVDHALEFLNRVAPVVGISAAEIEGVIAGEEFGGVHHQADCCGVGST